jgi:hypothetical protein
VKRRSIFATLLPSLLYARTCLNDQHKVDALLFISKEGRLEADAEETKRTFLCRHQCAGQATLLTAGQLMNTLRGWKSANAWGRNCK